MRFFIDSGAYLFVESEKDVLAFEISMCDSILVQVSNCSRYVLEKLSASRLTELSLGHDIVKEVTATV